MFPLYSKSKVHPVGSYRFTISWSIPNVYVILDKPMPLVGQYTTECYSLIARFLRHYLVKPRPHAPELSPPPNSSFENIFSACRTIVAVTKDSGDLYDQVKMQLERCVGELAQDLSDKKEKGVKWIKPFNETCAWFDERVVSANHMFPRSEVQVVDDFSGRKCCESSLLIWITKGGGKTKTISSWLSLAFLPQVYY